MSEATLDLWLSQAEQDGVISPGFRPHVQRKMLEQCAEIERLRAALDLSEEYNQQKDAEIERLRDELATVAAQAEWRAQEIGRLLDECSRLRKKCGPDEMIESDYI